MKIDKEAVLNAISAIEVADAIGMEMFPRGKNTYIFCPGHYKRMGREDSKPNNAILMEDGYKCFSCGAKVNTIDMVSEFCNLSFTQALFFVADLAGGVEFFATEDDPSECGYGNRNIERPLGSVDLNLLGIKRFKERKGVIRGVTTSKPDSEDFRKYYVNAIIENDEAGSPEFLYVLYDKNITFSVNDLYREDYEAYCFLIKSKAEDAVRSCYYAEKLVNEPIVALAFGVLTDSMLERVKGEIANMLQRAYYLYRTYHDKSGEILSIDEIVNKQQKTP